MNSLNIKEIFSKTQPKKEDTQHIPGVAVAIFILFLILGTVGAILVDAYDWEEYWIVVLLLIPYLIGTYFLFALKIASPWEKGVVLRFGKLRGLYGPGVFWMIPIVDTLANWIDHRVMVTPFSAEKTLTKDTFQKV